MRARVIEGVHVLRANAVRTSAGHSIQLLGYNPVYDNRSDFTREGRRGEAEEGPPPPQVVTRACTCYREFVLHNVFIH